MGTSSCFHLMSPRTLASSSAVSKTLILGRDTKPVQVRPYGGSHSMGRSVATLSKLLTEAQQ